MDYLAALIVATGRRSFLVKAAKRLIVWYQFIRRTNTFGVSGGKVQCILIGCFLSV